MNREAVKFAGWIVITLATIATVIVSINAYFAKSTEVGIVEERLDLKIVDDRIFQQEQQIQQMKNYQIFQRAEPEPELTPMEEEAIRQAETRLRQLEQEREIKEKARRR
jgi:hypothetical protein